LTGELSCKDEARVGQNNGLVRQWARRGTRPRQPTDQRYDNAYLFGAICPARGVGAALALPHANTEAMQLHLDEISRNVAAGAHAVLIFDRAGWHTSGKLDMPDNITPIWLPSRAPELNPVENVCQHLRQNWLANTVFETFDDIIEPICHASNQLTAQPETIASIGPGRNPCRIRTGDTETSTSRLESRRRTRETHVTRPDRSRRQQDRTVLASGRRRRRERPR
jgi:hypothetical protein